MKKYLFAIGLLLMTTAMFAGGPVNKGQLQLNAGVGLNTWNSLPLYVGLDYGVHPDITIGGELSFLTGAYDYNGKHYNNGVNISANGNYHFNTIMSIPRNWDFYAGLNLGILHGFYLGAQVGGRYYFSNFGLNLEFGGGSAFSGGKFGISYRF